ncbi:MAG: N-acetyltransferase [Pseudomonadota bacterium]
MTDIIEERAEDQDAVEALFDVAFAPGRANLSSYRLRIGAKPVEGLCLTAKDEFDVVVGAIRYWPIRIGDGPADRCAEALLLGPVAVHPTRQSEGLGARLIFDSLSRAETQGWRIVLLVGDEPYYGRFGFRREAARRIAFPEPTNPKRVLGLALRPGALDGVVGAARPWNESA